LRTTGHASHIPRARAPRQAQEGARLLSTQWRHSPRPRRRRCLCRRYFTRPRQLSPHPLSRFTTRSTLRSRCVVPAIPRPNRAANVPRRAPQVYECMVRGIAVMRRRSDSFVNATQILKVAGIDKGRRTKILEKEILPGKHEIVQGGYGKYQGTWRVSHSAPSLRHR
jgi:hypothetical protein